MWMSEDDVESAKALCEDLSGGGAQAAFASAKSVVEAWFALTEVWTAIVKLATALIENLSGEPLNAEMDGVEATDLLAALIPEEMRMSGLA